MADEQLRKAWEGLMYGGNQFLEGQQKKSQQNELQNLYTNTAKRLNELISPQPTMQDKNMGKFGQVTMPTQSEPNFQEGLRYLYEQLPKFSQYGDQGNAYTKSLQGLYESTAELNKPPKKDIREVNGQLVDITNGTPQVLFGEKKEKPVKKSVEEWGKMSYEDILKEAKTDDDLLQAYYLANPEVQQKIYDNYKFVKDAVDQNYKEGIYTPKAPGSHRRGGLKMPPLTGAEGKDLSSLKRFDELNQDFESLDDKGKENRRELEQKLMKQFNTDEQGVFELASRLNNATPKEQKQILSEYKTGVYKNEPKVDSQVMQERINAYSQYPTQLDQAYAREQAGETGVYDQVLLQFYNELKWDYDNGVITRKEYDMWKKAYPRY